MAESAAYSVNFLYDDPRVLEAQHSYMTRHGVSDDGLPIPDWNDYFNSSLKQKQWASVGISHRHESDRVLAEFSFIRRARDATRLLEAAVFDMRGWMQLVGLSDVEPLIVELKSSKSGEANPQQDVTIDAKVIIEQIITLEQLSPSDFTQT
jgi:hypothetical protein